MIKYPLEFNVKAQSKSGIEALWEVKANEVDVKCSIPNEFNGPGGGASPEDFYIMALVNCFIATFKVLAQNSKLEFDSIEGAGNLIVDRNDSGVPWMAKANLNFQLKGAKDKDRAKRLLEKTQNASMILNSVKSELNFKFELN